MDGIITLAQARALDKVLRDVISSSGEGTNSYRYPEGLLSYVEQQPRSPWPMLVYYEGFGAMKLLLAYSRPEGNSLPAITVLKALEVYRDVFGGHLRLFDDPGPDRWWFTIYEDSVPPVGGNGGIKTRWWERHLGVSNAHRVAMLKGAKAEGWGPCDSAEELLDALLGVHS